MSDRLWQLFVALTALVLAMSPTSGGSRNVAKGVKVKVPVVFQESGGR